MEETVRQVGHLPELRSLFAATKGSDIKKLNIRRTELILAFSLQHTGNVISFPCKYYLRHKFTLHVQGER
jgi:hypothetical protein